MRFRPARLLSLLAAFFALAPAVQAQPLTSCALEGTYVMTATLLGSTPSQVGGTVVFTPPASCVAGAVGTMAIDVVYTPVDHGSVVFRATVGYVADDTMVTMGDDFLIGSASGIANGIATSVPFNGAGALRIAGTMVRREVDAAGGTAGPQGPAGPTRLLRH